MGKLSDYITLLCLLACFPRWMAQWTEVSGLSTYLGLAPLSTDSRDPVMVEMDNIEETEVEDRPVRTCT